MLLSASKRECSECLALLIGAPCWKASSATWWRRLCLYLGSPK